MSNKTPAFSLLYSNKNITVDVAKYLLEATFTDHLTGEADELDITLEDTDHRWLSDWYPEQGATLNFSIGYEGEPLLGCGNFEIDEITVNDSPNTVQIRALSAGVTTGVRTVKHVAYDDKTLDVIINQVAAKLGFSVEGNIKPLKIERITQQETDLAFIKRLANSYGYMVKVMGKRLVFSSLPALNATSSIASIDRTELMPGWTIREQIRTVKQAATVTKHNPKTKQTVTANKTATTKASSDTTYSRANATTADVATAKADAALINNNEPKCEGYFSITGDTRFTAGSNISLTGFERFNGKVRSKQVTHRINRGSGYTTEVQFTRIDT